MQAKLIIAFTYKNCSHKKTIKQVMLNKQKRNTYGKYNVAYNFTLMPPLSIIEYKCLLDIDQKAYVE